MRLLIYIGCFLLMIVTSSVSRRLHIEQVGLVSNIILLALAIVDVLMNSSKYGRGFIEEFRIIRTTLFIIIPVNLIVGGADFAKSTFFLTTSLILISIFLRTQKNEIKLRIQHVILIFFLLNSVLSIGEKVFQFNLFPYSYYNNDIEETIAMEGAFRSSAFLGHPLTNAVCISIIMAFIIISNYKIIYKTALLSLGFISLLCFNAKAAIIIWVILLLFLIYYLLFKSKKKASASFYLFLSTAVILVITLVAKQGFGDRLLQSTLFDGSAQTRIDVFDAFDYVTSYDLWVGNPKSYLYITNKLDAGGVENSFIVLILEYGIPVSIFLIFLYTVWMRKLLRGISRNVQILLLVSFIGLGSANNSLSTATPWIFFILCYNAFLPDLEKFIEVKKYITYKKTATVKISSN